MQWTETAVAFLHTNFSTMTHEQIAERIGTTRGAVRNKCWRLGLQKKKPKRADSDLVVIRSAYEAAVDGEPLDLRALAACLNATPSWIARKAGEMGLSDMCRQRSDATRAKLSSAKKIWHVTHEHPRGMLGKNHSAVTREKLSKTGHQRWARKTEAEIDEWGALMAKNAAARPRTWGRGSWKAGWREIGGRRCFFRSRWEANYARYLEWLVSSGKLRGWEYEPKVFWFDQIKRGVRSYKPDFLVTELTGDAAWHEVKGWMDARSKTTLNRMRIYYPDERIILIDKTAYRSIERKVSSLVTGWE